MNVFGQTLRMIAFNIAFYLSHIPVLIGLVIFLPVPRKQYLHFLHLSMSWFELLERHILGLRYEMIGRENLPKDGCYIFASKHQSIWETYKLHNWLGDPAIIMKKELLDLPLWGWSARKNRVIGVDRGGRAAAMKSLVEGGLDAKRLGRPITIFPEGTRMAPGVTRPYKYGVAALYEALQVPVIPVAHNAGCFWPKAPFKQRGGTITVEILPAIQPGLAPKELLEQLQSAIEPVATKLAKTAKLR